MGCNALPVRSRTAVHLIELRHHREARTNVIEIHQDLVWTLSTLRPAVQSMLRQLGMCVGLLCVTFQGHWIGDEVIEMPYVKDARQVKITWDKMNRST